MMVFATEDSPSFDPQFAHDVLEGLGRVQKSIPCTWLYDTRGSELFEEITELPEYYPTRTEVAILKSHAVEMAALLGADVAIYELGSGSSRKTPLLLEALDRPHAYVPIDISGEFLYQAVASLQARIPGLKCHPICGDFTRRAALKEAIRICPHEKRAGFFPGSTIGNFRPEAAVALLQMAGDNLGHGAAMIVGVDSTNDPSILVPAYDDAAGVTAAFNLNLLARINRELGGNFELPRFRHEARFNAQHSRIEMHLVCQRDQHVRMLGRVFEFHAGESIHTENSYKYPNAEFIRMARTAGWSSEAIFSDSQKRFALHVLRYELGEAKAGLVSDQP